MGQKLIDRCLTDSQFIFLLSGGHYSGEMQKCKDEEG